MINTIIIIFGLFSIVAFLSPDNKEVKQFVYIFLGIILIFIAGFRGEGVDRDYENYVELFYENDYLLVEPSFVIITTAIRSLGLQDVIYIFIVFSILGVSIKFIAIKQLSQLWFLSIVIYLSNFFLLHEMTQIRAGIASGFLLLCIKPIYDRNWKKFLLFATLGFSFHYSALLIFPLWFIGKKAHKKILFLSIPVAYIIYFSQINLIGVLPIPGIQQKLEVYKQLQDLGGEQWNSINVFNLLFLARIAIFYFILLKYDLILANNKYLPILIKIYCIALISFLIFAVMPVLAFRMNELFGIVEVVLIPLLFYVFRPRLISKIVIVFIGVCLISIVLFYNKLLIF
ncbi:EpsG family protein [Flavobacterium sp. '19STA2R22 D10 B1']|uniref:EpsG family protein n=1 Tax=Flavobacterium aerium TaxID=3037261 RepID=UPI00278BC808|nr:EpsG family protein [Flavobacterium sp. '19STA2R22 D10 B1']